VNILKRLSVFAVVLALLVLAVSSASASDSQSVSGTWQFGSLTPISAQPVAGNCIIELGYTQNYQGDLAGSVTGQVRIMHFGPCDQPAAEVFHSEGTFQGTVDGVSGTFDFQLQGDAYSQGHLQGSLVILTGTDGLANLRGRIAIAGNLPDRSGTYSGDVHFEASNGTASSITLVDDVGGQDPTNPSVDTDAKATPILF
jgi:hypothetical protein